MELGPPKVVLNGPAVCMTATVPLMVLGTLETLSIPWLQGGRMTHTTVFASSARMLQQMKLVQLEIRT